MVLALSLTLAFEGGVEWNCDLAGAILGLRRVLDGDGDDGGDDGMRSFALVFASSSAAALSSGLVVGERCFDFLFGVGRDNSLSVNLEGWIL